MVCVLHSTDPHSTHIWQCVEDQENRWGFNPTTLRAIKTQQSLVQASANCQWLSNILCLQFIAIARCVTVIRQRHCCRHGDASCRLATARWRHHAEWYVITDWWVGARRGTCVWRHVTWTPAPTTATSTVSPTYYLLTIWATVVAPAWQDVMRCEPLICLFIEHRFLCSVPQVIADPWVWYIHYPNSTISICCGFLVQRVEQQMRNKSNSGL